MKSIIIQPHDLYCGESWICCLDFHNSEYLYDTFQSHRYVPAALLDKLFLRRYYCTVLFKYIHCILSFMYIKNVWRTRVISKLSLLQEKKIQHYLLWNFLSYPLNCCRFSDVLCGFWKYIMDGFPSFLSLPKTVSTFQIFCVIWGIKGFVN